MSNVISGSGDSDDLEALFDSIVMAGSTQPAASEIKQDTAATDLTTEPDDESLFSQIGHLTRKLHDTLRELGYDKKLAETVDAIPDTRERLAYIATMTQRAAERALTATEVAQPIQEKLEAGAIGLSSKWQRLFDNQLSLEEFKQLTEETRSYLKEVPSQTKATNAQLMEIMMAQDFQDLTGQVIKKVIDMAHQMERDMLQLLLATTPAEKKTEMDTGLLNGPVINAKGRADVVTSQVQVDDLLESLGF
ncbi:chemotaxis phosphatase, CheZ [Sulfuricella denitrificans skB26]|uniref:Protein phosphatase CheZ n=1 Tax=Sulfuricella denitrificans (strain DSM 22764 / NBRC 105220 / skB26) TaxID=1163617 RepID=S6AKB7_SULDS|nr:protein phosphatase CheZ [Sulfuricella denitrificans]BAN35049.1 chemotaxis phosphatase, CheZ [Sulfuricella denitrificans skB26]